MGGGGSGKSTQTTTKSIDPALRPLFEQTGTNVANIQGMIAPGFGEFLQPTPQAIPGLTQGQQNVLAAYGARAFGQPFNAYDQAATNYANFQTGMQLPEQAALQTAGGAGLYNSPELLALGQIGRFASGEIGSAPATQAAMTAVRNPVLNELGLAGLGNSSAVGTELGGAYAPILAQEMAIRAGVIPQLTGMGASQRTGALTGAQLQSQIANALRGAQQFGAEFLGRQGTEYEGRTAANLGAYGTAEEKVRQIEVQRGEATLKDFLRRQGLGSEFLTGVLSGFPAITGSTVVGKQSGGGK